MRTTLLLVLAVLGAAPAVAQSPGRGSWQDAVRRAVHGAAKTQQRTRSLRPTTASLRTTVAESEPNDSVRTADRVALGDRANRRGESGE
jgi:hypothetical protein